MIDQLRALQSALWLAEVPRKAIRKAGAVTQAQSSEPKWDSATPSAAQDATGELIDFQALIEKLAEEKKWPGAA